MRAEIIAIGTELTCGSKLDTNSQWLSRELESLGWTVTRHTTLADEMPSIVEELRAAAQRAEVVLITGGLGPTLDDLTREAMAEAFDQQLVRDPDSLRQIEAIFTARGRTMPERNQRQADRPEHAESIPNSCGTAPGVLMRVRTVKENHVCFLAAMPGVPAEMKPMFEKNVRPHLLSSGMQMCRKVIRTFGYGESDAERMLGDLTARGRNPEVGITASEAVISLWITARSESAEQAHQMCEETDAVIREKLGEAVYGEGDAELHDVVGGLLQIRHQKMALIEGSTTGGLLAMWMTESESLSSVVDQAMVMPGAWSGLKLPATGSAAAVQKSLESWSQVAQDSVTGFLRAHNVDFVLLSSPFEDEKAESGVTIRRGLVAVASRSAFETFDVSMTGNLAIFRQRAARTALNRLRLMLTADP
ncbi:MAG: molybdopterin-binding protein [Planctomycetaceae bacterium]